MGIPEEPEYKPFDYTCPHCHQPFTEHNSVRRHQSNVTCPHCGKRGDFVDVNQSAAAPVSIVKVRYIKRETGEPEGREYSYFTAEPLGLAFHVKAPTEHGHVEAVVTALDVPEAEVAAFRDRVRTIPAGSIMVRPAPEIELPAAETPPVAQVADPEPNSLAAAAEAAGAEVKEVNLFDQKPEPEPEAEPPQDEGPSEGEHVEQLWDEQKAAEQSVPPALVTIERQVGKPAPELLPLYLEAAGLLQFAKARVIATAEDLKPATNDLAIIATCKKAMFARKDELVGPMKAKLDLVNQAFNDIMFPVLEADRLTRAQVTKFDNDQRARAAEAKRIEDEKTRLAREEAAFTGTGEFDVPLGTIEEVAPPPERTRTDLGTLGGRDNWKARVVDFKLLDDQWKLPNESLLNSHARSTKGERPIPGVEFYNDRITTMRTKS